MLRMATLVLLLSLVGTSIVEAGDGFYEGMFPDGFVWGCASSAYQIEGAWNEGGKGLNIWDTFSHTPGKVFGGHTGDVACDSYHKIDEDVKLLKSMGIHYYRFSLSWARILPNGTKDFVNPTGIKYYNNLIDALLKVGVKPMVTLYHWDLPQALQDMGGWLNLNIIDIFSDYARICYENFGDRVKYWATLNEPFIAATLGFGAGIHAPGIVKPRDGPYKAVHTMLLAHGKAWHVYDKEFRRKQMGKVSIVLDAVWDFPRTQEEKELKAAERGMAWRLGWLANPIYINGDYPEVMKTTIARKSKARGIPNRLPQFTEAEKKMMKGTADYFALNHYTSTICGANDTSINESSIEWNYRNDADVYKYSNSSWLAAAPVWLKKVPRGLRLLLNHIKKVYGDPEIYITENGWSEKGENERVGQAALNDMERVGYFRDYINEALKATVLDGVNLKGYFAWSLMDNFEWAAGYHYRFGLHYIDFSDAKLKRIPKKSAKMYAKIVAENGFLAATNAATNDNRYTICITCIALGIITFIMYTCFCAVNSTIGRRRKVN